VSRRVAAFLATGEEPVTMARVEGIVATLWPHRPYQTWIETSRPRRQVSLRLKRGRQWVTVAGAGDTRREAFAALDREYDAERRR
jgi:hypothetical protein